MKKCLLVIIIILSILTGCSENPSQEENDAQVFPYPKTPADIQADDTYKLYYTGEKSGVQYYLKEIGNEELEQYSDDDPVHDTVLSGEEKSWVFVPVKDGKIVEYGTEHLGDVIAITMKIGYGDNITQPKQQQ